MTNTTRSPLTLLRQLLDWYDRDEASDDELDRVIAQARVHVQQSEAASSEYVLYALDSDRLLSGEICPNYAEAAADAAGLDDVLILRLPLPKAKLQADETADED